MWYIYILEYSRGWKWIRTTFRNMDESQTHVQKKQDANKKGKHNSIHTIVLNV